MAQHVKKTKPVANYYVFCRETITNFDSLLSFGSQTKKLEFLQCITILINFNRGIGGSHSHKQNTN